MWKKLIPPLLENYVRCQYHPDCFVPSRTWKISRFFPSSIHLSIKNKTFILEISLGKSIDATNIKSRGICNQPRNQNVSNIHQIIFCPRNINDHFKLIFKYTKNKDFRSSSNGVCIGKGYNCILRLRGQVRVIKIQQIALRALLCWEKSYLQTKSTIFIIALLKI